MARQSSTITFTLSANADWQAFWGGVFDAFITANGWTYVAQTGDINPNTATAGASGTFAGFRCYSTSVGSETWYVRVDMGYATSGAVGPNAKVQVGSGVNGSGTLTGQVGTQQTIAMASGFGLSGVQTYYISAAAGRMFFYWGSAALTSANTRAYFALHGGVDGTGAMSTGMDFFWWTSSNAYNSQNVPVSGTVPALKSGHGFPSGGLASEILNGNIVTFWAFTWNGGGGNNPSPAEFGGGITDFSTPGVIVTVPIYGVNHDYLATTTNATTNCRACFRYE